MDENQELNFIDCGVTSISNLHLHRNVTVLNLHANAIKKIDGLDELFHLRHLDLSSNSILRIEGLTDLRAIKSINLSFNKIKIVEGLEKLRSLVHINLSFNEIRDISGFRHVKGPSFKLASIELQGNNLRNVNHICSNFSSCAHLRHLVLTLGAKATNPVCQTKDYRRMILTRLKALECLDGKDRKGNPVQTSLAADMPDITEFLEFITSETASSTDENQQPTAVVKTPKIDAALRAYKRRQEPQLVSDSEISVPGGIGRSGDLETKRTEIPSEYQQRLESLERQLANLATAARDEKKASSSEENRTERAPTTPRAVETKKTSTPRMSSKSPTRSAAKVGGTKAAGGDSAAMVTAMEGGKELPETQVLHRLEAERDRRCRAEDTCRKLVEQLKKIQEDSRGDAKLQESTFQATSKLRQAYSNEREMRLQTEDRLRLITEELERSRMELEGKLHNEDLLRNKVKTLEEDLMNRDSQRMKETSMMEKQLHESHKKAVARQRELDILREHLDRSKADGDKLRSLMTDREEAHRQEMNKRYALDSPELQAMIEKCLKQEEEKNAERLQHVQEKVDDWKTKYAQLEDEFRLALRIEAARFNDLSDKFDKVVREADKFRQKFLDNRRRDDETKEIVAQLNDMIKEKEVAMREFMRSRQEKDLENKERIAVLEANVDEARRRLEQMEQLRQENKKLRGQSHAQESIIEGLRSERQLWGEELAHQGAALAQDRGRLEVQNESLKNETNCLKRQLEKEFEENKINRKIMDDQKDTIMKMKEALKEKDRELKKVQTESLEIQRELETKLQRQMEANDAEKDCVSKLSERKEDLKRANKELQNELDLLRDEHERDVAQWSERAKLISNLQEKCNATKSQWDAERQELMSERDRAVTAAKTSLERLQQADAAFRRQLDMKETAHRQETERLLSEAADRERTARERVVAVETEMRYLLEQKEKTEREVKARVLRLVEGWEAS